MLRDEHRNIQLARHPDPQPQDLVGHHVAAVKAFHARNVIFQVRHGDACLGSRHHRNPEIACEQYPAHGVVEVEVAFGVHEMRGQQMEFVASERQATAFVGDADHPVFGLAHFGEMGSKPFPNA